MEKDARGHDPVMYRVCLFSDEDPADGQNPELRFNLGSRFSHGMFSTNGKMIDGTCLQSGIGNRRSIIALIYLFAAIVFVGSWVGYRKTPRHETLARLLFQLGMISGLAVAILGYAMFNIFMADTQDDAAIAIG